MKTDDLISLLASGAGAVEPHAVERRYAKAVAGGALAALLLMLSMLSIRPDLADAARLPLFWLKIGFVVGMLAASLFAALRLSRPAAQLGWVPGALAAPVLVIWIVAVSGLLQADPEQRLEMLFGATWRVCPLLIAVISVPVFIAAMWAMKGLAPTRPRVAGFAAGLLAGAVAALVYCLHCPEIEAPFVGVWYVLGMLVPAGVGAALGRALLRW